MMLVHNMDYCQPWQKIEHDDSKLRLRIDCRYYQRPNQSDDKTDHYQHLDL